MDFKAVSSIMTAKVGLILTLLALSASRANAKSIPGAAGSDGFCLTPLSMQSLYPTTTTLALHPLTETPFQDGSNPPASPCPERGSATVNANDPISRRSTCPYEYITNYDRQRIPALLQEARCLCDGCLDPRTGDQHPDLVCQEIKYPMKVLRKSTTSPINSFEMYSLSTEQITVGCACSRLV